MQKVITINLNGNAYQLDEAAYDALVGYLDRAAAHLKDNPDLVEIMADLEQAIAEKCQRYLSAHKTVVTAVELQQILDEMGPVAEPSAAANGQEAPRAEAANDAKAGGRAESGQPPKRLYQIREGAMLSGVCNGLAAYFGIDVTIVRIIFVILAFLTKGVWILAYVILMFVIPYADTSEERAAAYGLPFSARDLVEQAKRRYAEFADRHVSRRQWRQEWRAERRAMRERVRRAMYGPSRWWAENVEHPRYALQVLAGVLVPIISLFSAAFFFALLWAAISLGTRGEVFGWPMPEGVPLWAAMLALFLLYQMLATPLMMGRYAAYRTYGRYDYGWLALWSGLLRVGFTIFFFWMAYAYLPEFRDFINRLPDLLREIRLS
jgi:phage shock protein PspC (stress-responsive transcriptional regulator)